MKNQLLNSKELSNLKNDLNQWKVSGTNLIRDFHFKNFIEAFAFITKIAIIAESMGHHPDWSNSYSSVKIKLTSHDLGGISKYDIELAHKINDIE